MKKFDIAIAWEWDQDREFIYRINDTFIKNGLKCYLVYPYNLYETMEKLHNKQIHFRTFLDRASDARDDFIELAHILNSKSNCFTINKYKYSRWAQDKAHMHIEFLESGIKVPYTAVMSATDHNIQLSLVALENLGRPFIIKPANGGGGAGVVVGAESLNDVLDARRDNYDDKVLLQEKIYPAILEGMRAWFRVFYICGRTIVCWWDDQTRFYNLLTKEQEKEYKLGRLRKMTSQIAKECKLNFFSTEICITKENKLVCVDYVNDPCDMRPLSIYYDGVPDIIINKIIEYMMIGTLDKMKTKKSQEILKKLNSAKRVLKHKGKC